MEATRSRRPWTKHEDEYLQEHFGSIKMKYLMAKLKRSEEAIKLRHYALTGSKDMKLASGLYSLQEVADTLGVARRTVSDWIASKGLPAVRLHEKTTSQKTLRYYVDAKKLWKWVDQCHVRINYFQIKRGIILPEPPWLKERVRTAVPIKRAVIWTNDEDETAYFLQKCGYSPEEIAKQLHRTKAATIKRLVHINKRKKELLLKAN